MEGLSNISLKPEKNNSKETELQKELILQKQIAKSYEEKFNSLFEDFNYNVQLIYERDREIAMLHEKIEELVLIIKKKDHELKKNQGLESKVRQLESDKIVLSKRLEAFLASNRFSNSKGTPKKYPKKIPDFSITRELAEGSATDRFFFNTNDMESVPLSQINSDLEKRIKALELENQSHKEDPATLSPEIAITEKLSLKEKEISDLIKSLSPYKLETQKTSKNAFLKSFDLSANSLISDLDARETLKKYPSIKVSSNKSSSNLKCYPSFSDY